MIREIKGDMFAFVTKDDYIAHCISNDFVLGAGIAKTIDEKYHVRNILKGSKTYKDLSDRYTDGTGYVLVTGNVFNLVTKRYFYNKPSYASIAMSIDKLAMVCKQRGIQRIHMPRIGCYDSDGLKWESVYKLICHSFCNSGVDVYIYNL